MQTSRSQGSLNNLARTSHGRKVDVTLGGFDSWTIGSGLYLDDGTAVALYCGHPGIVLAASTGDQQR